MLRSILAILTGYAVFTAIADLLFPFWVLPRLEDASAEDLLWLTLIGCFVAAAAAGWVAVTVAARRRWKHVQALVALLLVAAAIRLLWSAGAEPMWFQIATIGSQVVGVFVGGSLKRGSRL